MWDIAVHLTVAGDVPDGVFCAVLFSREMPCMRSWTLKLSQFQRVFLASLAVFHGRKTQSDLTIICYLLFRDG